MNTLLLTAWIVCQSFDVTTTAVALSRPQFYEGNPLMRGPHLYVVKVGVNVGLFLWHIHRDDKQHWSRRVVPLTMAVGGCLPGAMNLSKLVAREKHSQGPGRPQ